MDEFKIPLKLAARFRRMFKCDQVRVTAPCGRLFLILGWSCNTRQDKSSQWYRNGKPVHFDYVSEQVVANGCDIDRLIASAEHYHNLTKEAKESTNER